jgi:hypothetical protein
MDRIGRLEVYRYERKFVVSERAAEAIRSFVATYLVSDSHMAGAGPHGYCVRSLYLDSPQLALYRQSKEGIKNRYKLRIRYYDEDAGTPAFLEIKRRSTETVHKLRAAVAKPSIERLLRGERLRAADLLSNSDTSLRALSEFSNSQARLSAVGAALVSYRREACVSHSAEGVRVTFDRDITAHRCQTGCTWTTPGEATRIAVKGVVLELKYNGRAPRWMHDLVTTFNLQRLSFPKYIYAVDALKISPKGSGSLAGGARS